MGGRLDMLRAITIPFMAPHIVFIAVRTHRRLAVLAPAFVMTGGSGARGQRFLLYSLYLFLQGVLAFHMG